MTRRSNCVLCAVVLWLRMRRRWEAAGRPHGQEPYLLIRSSRLAPGWIPHVLVGRWSRTAPREMLVVEIVVGYLVTLPDRHECRLGPDRTRAEVYAAQNRATMIEPIYVKRSAR